MDWIWVIVAVISIVVGLSEQLGKKKKPTSSRPWVSTPIDPPVMLPSDTWPLKPMLSEEESGEEGTGMEGLSPFDDESSGEGSAAPEMISPIMASMEGEGDWFETPADDQSPVIEEVRIEPQTSPQSELGSTINDDWETPSLTFTPDRVIEAVIFSEVLARRPLNRGQRFAR